MKTKELTKLRDKKIGDLGSDVVKKRTELSRLYAEFKSGKDVNPKDMRKLKLDIAQISTIIREKELLEKKDQKIEKKKEDNKQ